MQTCINFLNLVFLIKFIGAHRKGIVMFIKPEVLVARIKFDHSIYVLYVFDCLTFTWDLVTPFVKKNCDTLKDVFNYSAFASFVPCTDFPPAFCN